MKKTLFILIGMVLLGALVVFASPDLKEKIITKTPFLEKYEFFKDDEVSYVRQVITKDSETARTIMWQSYIPEGETFVEYRIKDSSESFKVKAAEKKFEENKVIMYLHTAELLDLKPETLYEYRITYAKKSTPWFFLETAGKKDYKVLIFPDSQSSDYSGWKELVGVAWKNNSDAQFFINMGDLVDNGEDNSQWRSWFNATEKMIENIPIAPVMGNHETYNIEWKVRKPLSYLNLFELPSNGDSELKNQYYSFDFGDVHYTVLNTQLEELEKFYPGLTEKQLVWLKKDLSSTYKKWKVVLLHKDVLRYPNKKFPDWVEGISDIGKIFMPIFDQYKVDVVYSAHLHTYRRRGNILNFDKNLQGPLYILTGVAGNVRYTNFWKTHSFDEYVAPQPETDNYLTMEVSNKTLKIKAFLGDGKQIDQVEITK